MKEKVTQSCPTLRSHGLLPVLLLCPRRSPGKSIGSGLPLPSPGNPPNRGIKPRYPTTLHVDFLPTEPQVKPDVRIIIEIKCTIDVAHLNHSKTTPITTLVCGTIVFHETGPWCQQGCGLLVKNIRSHFFNL